MSRPHGDELPRVLPVGCGIALRNRQRTRRVNLRLLREITRWLLQEKLRADAAQLCLHLVNAREMAQVNQQFLRHQGSTDVITFDATGWFDLPPPGRRQTGGPRGRQAEPRTFHGEIYISIDDAVAQARRFRTTWPSELARYAIHGLLHLAGYDDLQAAARRRMKRAENRLLAEAATLFPLSRLARPATVGLR